MTNLSVPAISLCIPAYNQTIYLKILLTSIADQHFRDYEIIISDDSTTDDVYNLVMSFGFNEKLKYLKNKPPLGSPSNWNNAIQNSRGKYIKIMHHDDAFTSPDSLGKMVECAVKNNYDYIFCDTLVQNTKNPKKSRVHKIRNFKRLINNPELLLMGNFIGAPSTLLLKNELGIGIVYNKTYIWLVDIEFYIRLMKQNHNGGHINEPLILTHHATEHQVTTSVLSKPELQVKEHALLFNNWHSGIKRLQIFFTQVKLTRIFFDLKITDKKMLTYFDNRPQLLVIYFHLRKTLITSFFYLIFIKFADAVRKLVVQ